MSNNFFGRKTKLLLIVVIISTIAYLAIYAISNNKKDIKKAKVEQKQVYVHSSLVKNKTEKINIKLLGVVKSSSSVDIKSLSTGVLKSYNEKIKQGAKFKKGDLLFSVYDNEFNMSIIAERASFKTLISKTLSDIKIDYSDEFEIWKNYFENINVEKQLGSLPKSLNKKFNFFINSKGITRAYYLLRSLEEKHKKYFYYAPFTGTVTNNHTNQESFVTIGTPVISIVNTEKIEIELPVSKKDYLLVLKNNIKITIEDKENKHIADANITRTDGIIDNTNQSLNIYLNVFNNSRKILNGEYLNIVFNNVEIENVFKIPRMAILDATKVFIYKKDKVTKKIINVIKEQGDYSYIKGLYNNDTVIIESISTISENSNVKPRFSEKIK